MDTYGKGLREVEVEDIGEEVYYREMLGCTAKVEGPGACATLDCGEGEYRVCEKPGETGGRRVVQSPTCGPSCEDAC